MPFSIALDPKVVTSTGGYALFVAHTASTDPTCATCPLKLDPRMPFARLALARSPRAGKSTVGYRERGEYSPSLVLALRTSRVLEPPVESLFSLDPLSESDPARGRIS